MEILYTVGQLLNKLCFGTIQVL